MNVFAVMGQECKTMQPIPMNMLFSFLYFNDIDVYTPFAGKILIDSGAFTFQKKGTDGLNKHVKDYKKFINKYKDNPKVVGFFEMDIDNVIGYREVQSIREELLDLTPKIIPVWHKTLGINEYKHLCNVFDYISFSGVNGEDVQKGNFLNFVKTAHNRGARVHGLGVGAVKTLHSIPFDSVDSSTWLVDTLKFRNRILPFVSNLQGQTPTKEFLKNHRPRLMNYLAYQEYKKQQYYYNYWNDKNV